ncbi:STAS domain-containing protein [Asanoa sp. NPDC049518]|uniref:STAS domain-containing protein n=1 Tax=unclassified Asanoa TaxID=2685164 RepID=UPI00342C415A
MHVSRLLHQSLTWLRKALLSDVVPPWPTQDADEPLGDLDITGTTEGGWTRVEVRGEIDHDTARQLRSPLELYARRCHSGCAIDLRRAPFIDTAGVAVVAGAFRIAHARGAPFQIRNATRTVSRTLRAAGLGMLIQA